MVRSKDKYTVSVDFPPEMEERVKALAEHEGASINAVINRAVLEAVLAYEGDQTTRVRVRQIQEDVAELKEMVKLSNAVGFAGLNALELTVKVSDQDWARVHDLVQVMRG